MPIEIIALLLVTALMHAVWNGMIKGADDGVVMASWVYGGAGVLMAPALLFLPVLPAKGVMLVSLHFALHMVYKILIIKMYRDGDFSRVFPVARGTAPALVTLAAIPAAGELPPPYAIAGVSVICLGLIAFAAEPRALERANRKVLLIAGAAGVIASMYTVVDTLGVRIEGAGLSYFAWLFVGDAVGMALLGVYWRGRDLLPGMASCWKTGLSAAVLSIASFASVLWVVTFMPVGPVVAVRETSIVMAALIGALFFKEGFGARRVVAACIIVAGIALLNSGA